ncbi:MAG: alpha-amylase family glycosyl hydrolase [Ilumatobacteraceae bacterium]
MARRPLDERAAWLIAYPDHVRAAGRAPLAVLGDLVSTHLAPEITGVHTLPVHPSSSDGGFSVRDHSLVDPAFGTWADLDTLAGQVTWMADAVVNHVSAQGRWFRWFLAGEAPYDRFFVRLPAHVDTSAVVRPRTSPLAHPFQTDDGHVERVWTTFSADQVDLDFRTPEVLLAIVEAVLRYVAHGARAVRLDAIAFVWKDPATPSIHLPEAHAIVQLLRACLDEVAPDVVLVTETNVPHAENVAYFGDPPDAPEADAVYQFPLAPLVLHAAVTGSTRPLVRWLQALAPPPAGRTFLNFLASHDGIGVRPVEGLIDGAGLDALVAATKAAGGVVNQRTADGVARPYELAVSWFALMSAGAAAGGSDEATAIRRHLATHAVALALQGVPLLYLGSLFGVGNDTATFARTGHGRDLNRARLTLAGVDSALGDPRTRAAGVWSGLRAMLATRASSPAFHPAGAQVIHDSPDGTVVVERIAPSGERAVVAVNLTDRPQRVTAPIRVGLAPWSSEWRT